MFKAFKSFPSRDAATSSFAPLLRRSPKAFIISLAVALALAPSGSGADPQEEKRGQFENRLQLLQAAFVGESLEIWQEVARRAHAFMNFWSTGEMKRLVFAFLTLPVLAGCSTMEGLGRDVEKLGNTIEEAARKSRGLGDSGAGARSYQQITNQELHQLAEQDLQQMEEPRKKAAADQQGRLQGRSEGATGGEIPAAGGMLVGEWVNTPMDSSSGTAGRLSYEFFADGSYEHNSLVESSLIGCHSSNSIGTFSVQGATIAFRPTSGTYASGCMESAPLSEEGLMKRTKTEGFRFTQDRYSGQQQLCLSDNKGESCYSKETPSK